VSTCVSTHTAESGIWAQQTDSWARQEAYGLCCPPALVFPCAGQHTPGSWCDHRQESLAMQGRLSEACDNCFCSECSFQEAWVS
jgi:hypothetical protein